MSEEQTKQENNPLGIDPVGKLIARFAIPSVIAMLVSAVYNIVDQFFIGQMVGQLGNAATNVAYPLTTCCVALGLLFGVGGAANFNLNMGAKKYDIAPYYIGNSLTLLLGSGTLLAVISLVLLRPMLIAFGSPDDVLPYAMTYVRITALGFPFVILATGGGHLLRADGSPRMTMISSVSGALINVVLDALFVVVFRFGMAGAAWATVIGQLFSGGMILWYMNGHTKTVELKRDHLKLRGRQFGNIVKIGMTPCFNQCAIILMQVVLNNSLTYYGARSIYGESIPLACAGISMKVSMLFFSMIIGIGQGSQPIQSFNYGAGNYARVRKAYYISAAAAGTIAMVSFTLFQLFPKQILGIFGEGNDLYFECGTLFFRVFLFMTWANFMQPITSNLFSSIGKSMKGILMSLMRQVLILVPLLLLLPRAFGFEGLLYAGPLSDFVALVFTVCMLAFEMRLMKRQELAVIA